MSSSARVNPLLGLRLDGRYRLKAVIGRGGMGQVYEAEDTRLGRKVAIKVMRDGGDDESLGERLFRDARGAARADHPAVITVYGYGMDAELGVSYVVMERLQGETLASRIERAGPLPIALVTRLARELSDALAAVHAAGVVHRDLKPSNVFLAVRGLRVDEVKLLDFGAAKHLDMQTLTSTGQVYGTPMYMAPEQLLDSKSVDARCDLYALGVLLFECLTGAAPYAELSGPALLAGILSADIPDPVPARPDLPERLAQVVRRCLQKRPSARFADAGAVLAALEAG